MKKTCVVCDCCDKLTRDFGAEIGWIGIGGGLKITITAGRDFSGTVNTALYSRHRDDLDFCSVRCFLEWLSGRNAREHPSEVEREVIQSIVGIWRNL